MELALNLVWFFVSLAAFALLEWRWYQPGIQASVPVPRWKSVVQLVCALVILFPVVSLSDDLHEQAIAVEESQPRPLIAKAELAKSSGAHSSAAHLQMPIWAEPRASSTSIRPIGRVEELLLSTPANFLSRPRIGRAPPTVPA